MFTDPSGNLWLTDSGFNRRVLMFANLEEPGPASNLSAAPIGGRRIRLGWSFSPSSSTAAQYNIYWDSGTGKIDYSVIFASVPASSDTYTTGSLTAGITYRFGVRTRHINNVVELNRNVVASAMAVETVSATAVQAAIKVPQTGRRVSGNRVTVLAEIISGNAFQVKQVEFQYRSVVSTTAPWISVTAANINHPNPDVEAPYFVHWDVTGLSARDYELRAVAADIAGQADSSPPGVVVTVDPVDPDVEEKTVSGVLQKREKINNALTNTVKLGDDRVNATTVVVLPPNSLNDSTATLKVVVNPPGVPAAPKEFASPNLFRDITLGTGQTILNAPATITTEYPDADDDGIVDGTTVRADKLALYAFDAAAGRWQRPGASTVDAGNKTVTSQTPHFSLFGLFAPAAADISDVLVYPVPFVPNDGNADNGKPFNGADPDSGIIFDNLTQAVKIEVFTVTGKLAWERSTDSSSGKLQWDARNLSGRDVASGGYFAVITDKGSGTKVVRKLAVIR